jgi:hypothetical protein
MVTVTMAGQGMEFSVLSEDLMSNSSLAEFDLRQSCIAPNTSDNGHE